MSFACQVEVFAYVLRLRKFKISASSDLCYTYGILQSIELCNNTQ